MIKNLFFDTLFAIFVIVFFVAGFFFVSPAMSSTGTRPVPGVTQPNWPALPGYDFTRDLWGQVGSAFSHQAQKGVLIGDDKWLFAGSGVLCPAGAAQNLNGNLDYITGTRNLLAERNTTLLVVLIPWKKRLLSDYHGADRPTACRRHIYDKALDYLDRHRIPVADMLATMRELPQRQTFSSLRIHNGDLMETEKPMQLADAGTILTDGQSAYNANLNFKMFLKQALQTDLTGIAGDGQGPFTVMDRYLRDAAWTNNSPDVVVWEIPERYLLMKHGEN